MKKAVNSENSVDSSTNRREFLGKIGKSAIAVTAASVIVPFINKNSSIMAQTRGNGNSFYQQLANACMQ